MKNIPLFSSKGEFDLKKANDNLHVLDFKTDTRSTIGNSGNSDVDVTVNIDTTPIAYAMLCTLLATSQISSTEFNAAVRKLEDFASSGKFPSIKDMNDLSLVKLNKRQLRR